MGPNGSSRIIFHLNSFNLITGAETLSPSEVTFTGSRDDGLTSLEPPPHFPAVKMDILIVFVRTLPWKVGLRTRTRVHGIWGEAIAGNRRGRRDSTTGKKGQSPEAHFIELGPCAQLGLQPVEDPPRTV